MVMLQTKQRTTRNKQIQQKRLPDLKTFTNKIDITVPRILNFHGLNEVVAELQIALGCRQYCP